MILASPADRLRTAPSLRKSRVSGLLDAALVLALICGVLVHLYFLSRLDTEISGVFARALLLSTMLSVIPVSILWFLDRRERESLWMLALAFLWGGVIATTLSMPLNGAFFRAVDHWIALHPVIKETLGPRAVELIAAPLSAPIVEEITKAAGVAVIFWMLRGEFDSLRDGFVYGALVGVGFNWFEAPLYVMQDFAGTGVATYGQQLGGRYGLLGLGGHPLFTGLFGLFLGLAAQTSRRWLKVLAPILGLLLAITAHFINNVLPLLAAIAMAGEGQPPPAAEPAMPPDIGFFQAVLGASLLRSVIFFPFTLIVLITLWRSGVWERRVIRDELESEVGRYVMPAEYEAIVADRLFRTRRISELHPRRSAALVNAQHELAFRKRRVRNEGGDPEADDTVVAWRRDIERLRSEP